MRDPRRVKSDPGSLAPVADNLPALARDKRNFFTRAAGDGDVYGELVRKDKDGVRWRRWDPYRSKVAAALHCGGVTDGFEYLLHGAPLLYLGAASGTTVSHLADNIAPEPVFAVEFAPRSFQDLLEKLRPWKNVFPIHGDARNPGAYKALVGEAGAIVQDIAQAGQVEILRANAAAFLQEGAMALLFLKARSEDSSADPDSVFSRARKQLDDGGFSWIKDRPLDPYDKDHRAFFARWDG